MVTQGDKRVNMYVSAIPFLFVVPPPAGGFVLMLAMKSSKDLGTCFLVSSFSFLPSSSLKREPLVGLSLLVSVKFQIEVTSVCKTAEAHQHFELSQHRDTSRFHLILTSVT